MSTFLSTSQPPAKHMIAWAHPSSQPKQHLDRFRHFCADGRTVSVYCVMGHPFPLKIAPSHEWICTPSNTSLLGPTEVLNPNGISIGSAVFAGHTSVTDRPTHRQTNRPTDYGTRWVTIGRIYVRNRLTAMLPNNSRLLLMLSFLLTRKFRFIFWVVYYVKIGGRRLRSHVGETDERPAGDRRPPLSLSSEIRGKPGSSEADDEASL